MLAALALSILPTVAAEEPKPTLALVGGQVVDGFEGPPLLDGVVLIAGERIVAVGPRSDVAVPAGTPIIDTEGMSVLPGLMDMHVHLMILGHADYEHWDKTYMSRFRDEIMPVAAKQLLMSGVTTARELGAPLEDILHVKARKDKDLGTLAPGRYADVIAVRGDILTHIDLLQRVDVVVKNGVRVK